MRLVQERRQLQAQALVAAQEAAHAGRPLQRERDSFLSRASTQQYYTREEEARAWPPAEHLHQHQYSERQQQQQCPPTPAVAVPLAPLPGQSSHLSVSPASSNAAPRGPYHQAGHNEQPKPNWRMQPSQYEDDAEFVVQNRQRPPSPVPFASGAALKSEDELLWLRMQEERERVLQRQALGGPGAGGYGEDGESVMDFRLQKGRQGSWQAAS